MRSPLRRALTRVSPKTFGGRGCRCRGETAADLVAANVEDDLKLTHSFVGELST